MNREEVLTISNRFQEQLVKIKVALFDVDGILTDGRIYYSGQEVGYNRFFHTHDGYGMKVLMQAGLKVGIVTGGNSEGVKQRFSLLGLDYLYMGNEDKRQALEEIKEKANVGYDEILYMGDEFFDLPLLTKVGFAATVPDASFEVQEAVHYVTQKKGGTGAAREVIDLLRFVQKIKPKVLGLE